MSVFLTIALVPCSINRMRRLSLATHRLVHELAGYLQGLRGQRGRENANLKGKHNGLSGSSQLAHVAEYISNVITCSLGGSSWKMS